MSDEDIDLLEYYSDYDYYEFDDTAQCGMCGDWYCTCCGCDCWGSEYDEDYDEECDEDENE